MTMPVAVGFSLQSVFPLCHALALTSSDICTLGSSCEMVRRLRPLKVELVAADRSYSVDMSTAETEKKADAIEAEPTGVGRIRERGLLPGGDGQGRPPTLAMIPGKPDRRR